MTEDQKQAIRRKVKMKAEKGLLQPEGSYNVQQKERSQIKLRQRSACLVDVSFAIKTHSSESHSLKLPEAP